MKKRLLRIFACLGSTLVLTQSVYAESFGHVILGGVSPEPISSSGWVEITTVDEADRVDIALLLYLDFAPPATDVLLDDSDKSCLYVSPETTCSTATMHSPTTEGCKYCSEFSWDLLRNNNGWQIFHSGSDGPRCLVAQGGDDPPQ